MLVVFESREESFQISLCQSAFDDLFGKCVLDQEFEFVDRDVAILVSVHLLAQICFELLSCPEFVLEMSVHSL